MLQQTNDREAEMVYLKAFYSAAGNNFAIAALPLAEFALKHRAAAPPLEAYRRLTAAIAQKDGAAARQRPVAGAKVPPASSINGHKNAPSRGDIHQKPPPEVHSQ